MGKDTYLVIGGSGFIGRHIVEMLLARGDSVSVLDIVQRYHDTPFYSADISDQAQVEEALQKVRSDYICLYSSSLLSRTWIVWCFVYHPHCFAPART